MTERVNDILVESGLLLDAYIDDEYRNICPDCGAPAHSCATHNTPTYPTRTCYPHDREACSRGCQDGDYCARWIEAS